MKYVVMKTSKDIELIFIFDPSIEHKAFAEGLIRAAYEDTQIFKDEYIHPISAGFVRNSISRNNIADCYGRSESLNLDSRGKADTDLIRTDFL